jgi:hypothetical protein
MLANIFKNINKFFVSVFDFLSFRKNNTPLLNNDIEKCYLINDDTTTNSE